MRYKALDSWRGICALMVVLFHAEGRGPLGSSAFVHGAFLFVDFFFVLSGFVISVAYAARVTNSQQFREFLLRRFGRVWPLHAAIIFALLVLEIAKLLAVSWAGVQFNSPPFTGTLAPSGFLPSLLMVHAMGLLPALTWNVPSWSIGAEFWTYVVFALLVWWRRDRMVAVPLLIALCAALTIVLRSRAFMDVTYDLGFVRCLYGFFAGVLVHQLVTRRPAASAPLGTVAELASVAAVIAFVAYAHDGPWAYLSPLVFAGVILVFATSRGQLSTFLLTPPFQRLGTWSYSIYMTHLFILGVIHTLSRILGPRLAPTGLAARWRTVADLPLVADGQIIAFALTVIAVSSLTYHWIESPGQRFWNRIAKSPDTP